MRAPADIEARYGLETPVRTVLGSSKHSNRVRPGSPALSSPAGSVSGKLIRMFEDMSRSEARSSPTLSGKGGDEGSMVAMVDGATEEPVEVGVLMEEVVEPEKVKLDNYKAGEEADGGF